MQSDLGATIDEASIRLRLLDQLWHGLLVLAIVGAPVSLSRSLVTGWRSLYTIHLALAVFILLISCARRRLSAQTKALLAGLVPAAVAISGLLSFGFYSAGVVWMTISCLIVGVCYPRRTFLWVWLLEMLALTGVALAFVAGWLVLPVDANAYIKQPLAWLGVLAGTLVGVYTVVSGLRVYNESILALLTTVREQARMIEHQATHDALTGVPTLRLALDRLEVAAQSARRRGQKLALLYLDLDGFKQVNDSQGHAAGDAVLKTVAARLRGRLRGSDTLARIGGDEFIVIATELADRAAALALAQALVEACVEPIEQRGAYLSVGVSIGVAVFPDDGDDLVRLRQRADQAMYQVKRRGKRGVCAVTELEAAA